MGGGGCPSSTSYLPHYPPLPALQTCLEMHLLKQNRCQFGANFLLKKHTNSRMSSDYCNVINQIRWKSGLWTCSKKRKKKNILIHIKNSTVSSIRLVMISTEIGTQGSITFMLLPGVLTTSTVRWCIRRTMRVFPPSPPTHTHTRVLFQSIKIWSKQTVSAFSVACKLRNSCFFIDALLYNLTPKPQA